MVGTSRDGVNVYGALDCATWTYGAANKVVVAPAQSGYALEIRRPADRGDVRGHRVRRPERERRRSGRFERRGLRQQLAERGASSRDDGGRQRRPMARREARPAPRPTGSARRPRMQSSTGTTPADAGGAPSKHVHVPRPIADLGRSGRRADEHPVARRRNARVRGCRGGRGRHERHRHARSGGSPAANGGDAPVPAGGHAQHVARRMLRERMGAGCRRSRAPTASPVRAVAAEATVALSSGSGGSGACGGCGGAGGKGGPRRRRVDRASLVSVEHHARRLPR